MDERKDTPPSEDPLILPEDIRKRTAERLVNASADSLKETSVLLGKVSVRHLMDVMNSLKCWAGLSKGQRTKEDARMVKNLYRNIESMAEELEYRKRYNYDWRKDLAKKPDIAEALSDDPAMTDGKARQDRDTPVV